MYISPGRGILHQGGSPPGCATPRAGKYTPGGAVPTGLYKRPPGRKTRPPGRKTRNWHHPPSPLGDPPSLRGFPIWGRPRGFLRSSGGPSGLSAWSGLPADPFRSVRPVRPSVRSRLGSGGGETWGGWRGQGRRTPPSQINVTSRDASLEKQCNRLHF